MRGISLFVFITLLVAPPVVAQGTGTSGSIYSRFGLGERVEFPSSQGAMMGGAGVAIRSSAYSNLTNPALWSDGNLVRLSFGAEVQGLRAEDASGDQSRLTAGHVSGFQVTVPLYQDRLGVSASLRPYTRSNYRVVRLGTLIEPDFPADTVDYRVNLEGDGGLQEAQLGFGARVAPWLAVGVSGRALFGIVEQRQRTEYLPPAGFGETTVAQRTRMWGFGGTVGAVGTATGVLGRNDVLSIGAALTLPTSLSARRVTILGATLDQDTLRTERSGEATIPLALNAGVGYMPNARWHLAADVRYEPWTNFESDFAFTGYNPATATNELRDRLRIGGGAQFTPAGTDRNAPYLARTAYRFGAYYDQGYFSPRNQDISTIALTGGVSLPGLLPGARFDLGFEAGTRGTTNEGLVQDLFLKGTATINFGERWFIRRQFG